MVKVKVKKLSDNEIEKMGVFDWPVWEKDVSEFDWHYDNKEQCLIVSGAAEIESGEETVKIAEGDFVEFEAGFDCRWKVIEKIFKHYKLG